MLRRTIQRRILTISSRSPANVAICFLLPSRQAGTQCIHGGSTLSMTTISLCKNAHPVMCRKVSSSDAVNTSSFLLSIPSLMMVQSRLESSKVQEREPMNISPEEITFVQPPSHLREREETGREGGGSSASTAYYQFDNEVDEEQELGTGEEPIFFVRESSGEDETEPSSYFDVSHLDSFSRARVINFVKRYLSNYPENYTATSFVQKAPSVNITASTTSNEQVFFEMYKVRLGASDGTEGNAEGDDTIYKARLRLPFPEVEYGIIYGEGVANSQKDAELLASMHSEQIINILGFQIYTLSSMQRKYADNIRRQGRWAAMPQEGLRDLSSIKIPRPLRRLINRDESERGKYQLVDSRHLPFRHNPHTLLSPAIVDPTCPSRIKHFFRESGFSVMHEYVTMKEFPPPEKGGLKYIVARIKLVPLVESMQRMKINLSSFWLGGSEEEGDMGGEAISHQTGSSTSSSSSQSRCRLIAEGKGTDRHLALILASMHAELIIDAVGGILFPRDSSMQFLHARTARRYGRPVRLPSEDWQHYKPPPFLAPPLKLHVAHAQRARVCPLSQEEDFVHKNMTLAEITTSFINVDMENTDGLAQASVGYYLKCMEWARQGDPYLLEKVGTQWRATLLLPLPPEFPGVKGGVGIAEQPADAEKLAAMHALDVLVMLGISVFPNDPQKQAEFLSRRKVAGRSLTPSDPAKVNKTAPLPPGYRRINVGVLKRPNEPTASVMVGGSNHIDPETGEVHSLRSSLASTDAAAKGSHNITTGNEMTAVIDDPLPFRRVVHKTHWCLEPDTKDSYIIVYGSIVAAILATSGEGAADIGSKSLPAVSRGINRKSAVDTNAKKDTHKVAMGTINKGGQNNFSFIDHFGHTIANVRVIDPMSKNRIINYLAFLGKRAGTTFSYQKFRNDDAMPVSRCIINLPVPPELGDRFAFGEAPEMRNAEILACMHAEIILDTLGVPLYPDPTQQQKHAVAATGVGRYAPFPGDPLQSRDVETPPPFRMLVNSAGNAKISMLARRAGVSRDNITGGDPDSVLFSLSIAAATAAAETTISMIDSDSKKSVNGSSSTNSISSLSSMQPSFLMSSSIVKSGEKHSGTVTGSVLITQEPDFEGIEESSIDLNSKTRVTNYLRRTLRAIPELMIQTEVNGKHSLHIAKLWLAVPDKFGRRYAIGVAEKKKDAEALCYMHAERIIDVLGLHIFNFPGLQRRHSLRAAKAGRWAPLPEEDCSDRIAGNVRSPPALKLGLLLSQAMNYPKATEMALQDFTAWNMYIRDCRRFIEDSRRDYELSTIERDQVPLTGIPLVDTTLEEVSRATLYREAKTILQIYCNHTNLKYPMQWSNIACGPTNSRKCMVSVPVPGYEGKFFAYGISANREVATRRAAMHCLAMLSRLDPEYSQLEKSGCLRMDNESMLMASKAQRESREKSIIEEKWGSFDIVQNQFTMDGKIRIVELYTVCNALPRPQVLHKMRQEGSAVYHITYVEVVDEDGIKWVGEAQDISTRPNEAGAYSDLFFKMSRSIPSFQSLMHLARAHPHLSPDQVVDLSLPPEVAEKISNLVKHIDGDTVDLEISHEVGLDVDTEDFVTQTQATANPVNAILRQARLQEQLESKLTDPLYNEKFKFRKETLAIFDKKDLLLKVIEENQVIIICATTGCGKTTQVPQYILDHEVSKGTAGDCNIVVTQPRRISAMSISGRLAAERMEVLGDNVGYTIRLDSLPGKHINFVTAGVLLRVFQSRPDLQGIRYVIIDEIHERDINSDFLLILIKNILPKRPDLKVILMSATLQSQLFSNFFNSAPVIDVEGYTYPIQEFFLEDLVLMAKEKGLLDSVPLFKDMSIILERPEGKRILSYRDKTKNCSNPQGSWEKASMKMFSKRPEGFQGDADKKVEKPENSFDNDDMEEDDIPMLSMSNDSTMANWSPPTNAVGSVISAMGTRDPITGAIRQRYGFTEALIDIDYLAVQYAVKFISQYEDMTNSSILVFLPGWEEITRAKRVLEQDPSYYILPMHSSINAEEQMKCFKPAPEGKIKIVLSTNISESGVTIDDIKGVIDVGRAKEKSFVMKKSKTIAAKNEMGTMSQLVQVYASRANCIQRMGRAGRTREGMCIKLYTREHFERVADFQTPEILRQPLDSLCLQILTLGLGDPNIFLNQALEPPSSESVESAMTRLFELGATTRTRKLTPLGLVLGKLPVSPRVGKMILMGAMLRCLDSALTIAATSETDIFSIARDVRDSMKVNREHFSFCAHSDHIAALNGYNCFTNECAGDDRDPENRGQVPKITADNFKQQNEDLANLAAYLSQNTLHVPSLRVVTKYKKQFYDILYRNGFLGTVADSLPGKKVASSKIQAYQIFCDNSEHSRYAHDIGIVKTVIAAGLFPNVALYRGKKLMRNKFENAITPNSHSVVARLTPSEISHPFFLYEEMARGTLSGNAAELIRVMIRGLTSVSIWSILLLGANNSQITFRDDLNLGLIDDWIVFRCSSFESLDLIKRFKTLISQATVKKLTNPLSAENNALIDQIADIISTLANMPVTPSTLIEEPWEELGMVISGTSCVLDPSMELLLKMGSREMLKDIEREGKVEGKAAGGQGLEMECGEEVKENEEIGEVKIHGTLLTVEDEVG